MTLTKKLLIFNRALNTYNTHLLTALGCCVAKRAEKKAVANEGEVTLEPSGNPPVVLSKWLFGWGG
jgi:hypothetical protein